MLTPLPSSQLQSWLRRCHAEDAWGPVLRWDFVFPRPGPGFALRQARARGCRAAGSAPSTKRQLLGPKRAAAAGMWKVPVLLLVVGRALLWVPAEGVVTVPPEDDVTTPSVEDGMVTPGASEEPYDSAGLTAQAPTSAKGTGVHLEDLPTSESTAHAQGAGGSTAALPAATGHPTEDTQTTVEKGGFGTGTLIVIIVVVLLAVVFIGGIITVVVRKMSGRYLP